MHPFLPRGARALVAAGHLDWLAELRRLSVLFALLPAAAGRDLATLQRVFVSLQEAVYRFGGSVNQCLADDKGLVLVAGWGLPLATHENNAQRALAAALAMHAAVAAQGVGLAVGVSTGQAFCGLRGGPRRREYSMIGDTVNLAARLMQAAGDGVLCDDASRRNAPRLHYEAQPPLRLKGREQVVTVFRPREGGTAAGHGTADRPTLVGRHAERALLAARLTELIAARRPTALLLEGEAGLGKSRLIAELIERAGRHGVRVLSGQADAIEHTTPYHAWRTVLGGLLGLAELRDPSQRQQRVAAAFADAPEFAARAALLEAVLHLGFPPDPSLDRFSGPARAEAVRELIGHLLIMAAGPQPLLLVFEDTHWLDAASWSLVHAAALLDLPLLLVLSSRPLESPYPSEAAALLAMPALQRVRMQPLAAAEVGELICARLGVRALPEPVTAWIFQRGEGNPFFSEELAFALRDLGVLEVTGGEGRLVGGETALSRLDLPEHVQGVVTSRIDRLPLPEALALKVGSVIGREFAALWLAAVLPVPTEAARLQLQLGHLVSLDLLLATAAERHYEFKHATTQDVAYGLLSNALRRELHQRLGRWIEQVQSENLEKYFGLLAHHWTRAENREKALDYLDRAGRQSLRAGAHREAAGFFSRALALADPAKAREHAVQLARWRRQLADALWGLGDLAGAVEQSRLTLATLEFPAPRHRLGWLVVLVRESVRRLWRQRVRQTPAAACPPAAEAALAMQRIAERHYYTQDVIPMIAASLAAAGLSARAGEQAPVARSYGMLGLVFGLIGLHRVGENYLHRAMQHAARTEDLAGLVFAHYAYAGFLLGQARWADLQPITAAGLAHARALGDPQEIEVALTVAGHLAFYTGDYGVALTTFEQVRLSALGRSPQHTAWGHYALARTLVFRGEFAAAVEHLHRARDLLRALDDDMSAIMCHGLLALAHLRRGERDLAERSADTTMELMLANAPTVFAYVDPFAAVLEVRLARCAPTRPDRTRRRQVSAAAAQLRKLAFLFPLARARHRALAGLRAQLAGRDRRALACFREALAHAERHQLPWDRAHACHLLGRCAALDAASRTRFAEEARHAFARLGAAAYLDAITQT
jgi:class 3 adenylate cyclase/tetratricopeptide (TPR) repeat protein